MDIIKKDSIIYIVSGKARQGKDTTAYIMKKFFEEKNKKVIILAYGNTIRQYAKEISNWDGNEETKPRSLMQILGTEIIRQKIDKNFFVSRMIEDIKVYSYFFDIIIISDARLVHEIDSIKDNFSNAFSISVVRPNFDNGLTKEQLNHQTEIALDNYNKFDYILINDKTIEDLELKVRKILGD